MKELDWTKELMTEDGRTVRFLGEIDSDRPMAVAIQEQNLTREFVSMATREGHYGCSQRIVNRPVKHTLYVNVYGGMSIDVGNSYKTARDARNNAQYGAIAIAVPVTFTEGYGLDQDGKGTTC